MESSRVSPTVPSYEILDRSFCLPHPLTSDANIDKCKAYIIDLGRIGGGGCRKVCDSTMHAVHTIPHFLLLSFSTHCS